MSSKKTANVAAGEQRGHDAVEEGQKQSLPFKIVRTLHAGVFAGYVLSLKDAGEGFQKAVMIGARRIWHWEGAASLSELSLNGSKAPNDCKFPAPVVRVEVLQVIEVLDVTPEAQKNIMEVVPVWRA